MTLNDQVNAVMAENPLWVKRDWTGTWDAAWHLWCLIPRPLRHGAAVIFQFDNDQQVRDDIARLYIKWKGQGIKKATLIQPWARLVHGRRTCHHRFCSRRALPESPWCRYHTRAEELIARGQYEGRRVLQAEDSQAFKDRHKVTGRTKLTEQRSGSVCPEEAQS